MLTVPKAWTTCVSTRQNSINKHLDLDYEIIIVYFRVNQHSLIKWLETHLYKVSFDLK